RISMRVFRKLMNSVREVKLDSAGRITLPRELLDALGFDSQVVVSGLYDRVEIWPAETYAQDIGTDDADEELAEAVARLGL
ncbi:MAG: division/cell wall cluster transcriptional repressor MraZ, partial [Actinomycetota bacterium]